MIRMQKAKCNLAKVTFSPGMGLTETLVKKEAIDEYAQKLKQLEMKAEMIRKK